MAKIQDKLFDSGFNLGSPIYVQDGVNGAYVISANQIAWGSNSEFNNDTFGGTTEGLLTAIEEAIEDKKLEAIGNISGVTVNNTGNILSWGKTITVAKINGELVQITLPSNPDTNTDTKVTSVGNHYKENAKEITTEGLYKIKTDAAGHIISATSFNDFIEKSKVNELKQDIVNFKAYILGLNSTTTSSSSTTTSSSTTSTATVTVTPTVTPTGDSSITPEPDTTTPTTTPNNTVTVTVTNPDSVTGTPEPDTTTPTTTEPVTTPTTTAEDEVTTPTTTEEVTTPTTPMTTEVSTEEPVTETPVTSVTTGK